jgi:LPS-assembly protein
MMGGAQFDLKAGKVSQTQVGVGYVDDCLILALNYITSYSYSGSTAANNTILMQVSLRTLGGNTGGPTTGPSALPDMQH